jgi:ADP-heptose:LPS heptosyltransferase
VTTDRPPLVVRFGRLGDLVLTWPALAYLAGVHGPLELVTAARYAGWMAELPWIGRVWPLEAGASDLADVVALARRIREAGHGPVIDLHASLRSRALCTALGGADRRVAKDSLGRRARIGMRTGEARVRLGSAPVRPFVRRFLDAVGAPGDAASVPSLRRDDGPEPVGEGGPRLALLPGARRATKRWAAERHGELARRWRAETGGAALVAFGPGEEQLAAAVVAAADGAARPVSDLELGAIGRELSRCAVAVGGDTGLLHLAAAVGAHPVGLFGPTGVEMGYWPWEGRGIALAPELPCHPCTLYGSDSCPLDHHDCLARLEPDRVLATALSLLEGSR